MKKYRVTLTINIDENVESDDKYGAKIAALCNWAGCGYYMRNDISDILELNAHVEEIGEE